MKKCHVIGIDPGSPIAMVALGEDGSIAWATQPSQVALHKSGTSWDNNPAFIKDIIKQNNPKAVAIEEVRTNEVGAVASQAKYFASWWLVAGICAALDIPLFTARPAMWRKELMLANSSDKNASLKAALARWPADAFMFRYQKDHNTAEAALIGAWGMKCLQNSAN